MKVKLYKGPMHGKTLAVQDNQHELFYNIPPRVSFNNMHIHMHYPPKPIDINVVRYAWSNHTHPDGSRFFTYAP